MLSGSEVFCLFIETWLAGAEGKENRNKRRVILEAFKVMGQVELVVISGEFFSGVSCPAPHGLLRRALSYACEASMVLGLVQESRLYRSWQ